MTGRLTTHVLDTAHGCPAAGLAIELFHNGDSQPVIEATTNADGRCDAPLLIGKEVVRGIFTLKFHVGAYFRQKTGNLSEPAFLEIVPVTFGIADPEQHYHVPLLVSPFGYSTYRGS